MKALNLEQRVRINTATQAILKKKIITYVLHSSQTGASHLMCESGSVQKDLFKTDCWAVGIKALRKLGHHQEAVKRERDEKQKTKKRKITAVYQIVPR